MTTKTQGDVVVALATIESATKTKRTVGREEQERTEWALKLFIPSLGIKQYSTPCKMDVRWATDLMGGEEHRVKFTRGRLKEGKEGKYDTEWFWEIAEWDTEESLVLPESSTSSPNGHTEASGTRGDIFRTKEELRWTEALHIASRLMAVQFSPEQYSEGNGVDPVEFTIELAERLYQALEAGYPHLDQAPTKSIPEHWCQEHGESYHQGRTGANGAPGRWGHRLGDSDRWCMEAEQQRQQPPPEDIDDLPF